MISRTSLVLLSTLLMWQGAAAQKEVHVRLTVQEALYPGAPTKGVARHQEPVTVGVPLPDSDGIKYTSQLGLSGASVGQFRVLGRWPSGNIEWVLVDTQADVPAGGQNTSIVLINGHGNFGGAELARDTGSTLTVNTGPAQFVIRKAKFNLFDQVTVHGRTLVSHGSSQGLVLLGPSSGSSCGLCTDPYLSSNDASSTAVIEENGPARAVVKVDGSHVDAAGHAYMHYTVRMHFYRGKTHSKVEVILRNADESNSPAGDFNSAFKGFTSYEARITPALGESKSFKIATAGGVASGRFTGSESAYLYQAYSNNMETSEWNIRNCTTAGSSRCVASYIARTPAPKGGPYVYAQDGYQLVHGQRLLAKGDHAQYPQGWAELSDGAGAGVEIGVYQLSAYWPKSLQFVNGGAEARIGIWPNQNLATGGGQPYYQAWPAYSIHDLYFNFHNTGPVSATNDFLAFQHYLVARAPRSHYNQAGVFFYPLIDPSTEDNYYRSISIACCLDDRPPRIYRFYDWPAGGAGNQHELRWSYLRNFLERGLTGRYLLAAHFYRMVAEQSFPRSDGFDWRNHPVGQLNYTGLPTEIASANGALATRNWTDAEHAHWYGMTDYYFMTGDETIKDQILDGVKDRFVNGNIKIANGKLPDSRDIGVYLMGIAHLYRFLIATSDPDAAKLMPIAERTMGFLVFPELNLSGFGEGNPIAGVEGSHGISRTRGVQYGCCSSDTMGNLSGRIAAPFRQALLSQGMWELAQAFGPRWSKYNLTTDLAYGISQWALTEGYGAPPGEKPNAMNSGFIYGIFLDMPNQSSKFYLAPGGGQTNWYHFYVPGVYAGDLGWRRRFEWLLQRTSATHSKSMSGFPEYGSHLIQAVVDEIVSPPALQLLTLPVKVTNDGGGSYTLKWTVPQGARSYRIKYYPGKKIVDWIGFNIGTNKFIGDPTRTWPWFAAKDAGDVPSPLAAGSTQTYVFKGGSSNDYQFAVKAYVERRSAKRP